MASTEEDGRARFQRLHSDVQTSYGLVAKGDLQIARALRAIREDKLYQHSCPPCMLWTDYTDHVLQMGARKANRYIRYADIDMALQGCGGWPQCKCTIPQTLLHSDS